MTSPLHEYLSALQLRRSTTLQWCADCRRLRLRTPIRRSFSIHELTGETIAQTHSNFFAIFFSQVTTIKYLQSINVYEHPFWGFSVPCTGWYPVSKHHLAMACVQHLPDPVVYWAADTPIPTAPRRLNSPAFGARDKEPYIPRPLLRDHSSKIFAYSQRLRRFVFGTSICTRALSGFRRVHPHSAIIFHLHCLLTYLSLQYAHSCTELPLLYKNHN